MDAQRITREIDHPIYDCLYLALAERETAIVVTADKKFHTRVKSSKYASLIAWVENSPQEEITNLFSCE